MRNGHLILSDWAPLCTQSSELKWWIAMRLMNENMMRIYHVSKLFRHPFILPDCHTAGLVLPKCTLVGKYIQASKNFNKDSLLHCICDGFDDRFLPWKLKIECRSQYCFNIHTIEKTSKIDSTNYLHTYPWKTCIWFDLLGRSWSSFLIINL